MNHPSPSELTDSEYLLGMIDLTFESVPEIKRHHERMRSIANRLSEHSEVRSAPVVAACATAYRKKPVVVEAWRINSGSTMPSWVKKAFTAGPESTGGIDWDPSGEGLWINTLEGAMVGSMGDMLICGVKGELYACKPDIFALTYEPALAAPAVPAEPHNPERQRV